MLNAGIFRQIFGCALVFLAAIFSNGAQASISGVLSGFSYDFTLTNGTSTDQVNSSGNYAIGVGSNGFDFVHDTVTVSIDNGRFVQTLPPNSLANISGGKRYTSTGSGIRLLKVMNNGTYQLQIRAIDLSGASSDQVGTFTMTIGDDVFAKLPNSIPVGKISGSSSVLVGNAASLSGAATTDFNFDTLNYAWSIVSKPIGSTMNLSATGSAVSFTPDLNGYYAIKLTPSDSSGPGVPAVYTVQATGGPDLPPPPLSANNGFIELLSNFPEYFLGDTATLTVHLVVPETVPDYEYFFRAYLNNQPLTLTKIPGGNGDREVVTPSLTLDGNNTFSVDLFVQDFKLAKQFNESIDFYTDDIAKIDAALVLETDPDLIAKLQSQKAKDQDFIARAQMALEENRTKIGSTAQLLFPVN